MDKLNRIVEISQDVMGRRKIKVALHEIHPDAQHWNENGICYLEQYTRDNAESVKGMPLCVEFLDGDKDIPYGHGMTGFVGNIPVFEESEQVGAFEDWSIEDIEIDGVKHRILCATGYVNQNRYPHFTAWLDKEIEKGNRVFGSVEFGGTKENEGVIVYATEKGDGEIGRIPAIYDYIGYCIISVKPADVTSILLEFEKGQCQKDEFDVFEDGNSKGKTENEFDSVFDHHEINTATELDNVFLATIGEMNGDEIPENNNFDDIFGETSAKNIEDMLDVFM